MRTNRTEALKRMKARSSKESRKNLSAMLQQIEGLLANAEKGTPEYHQVKGYYDTLTNGLLIALAIACEELGYPTQQRKWKDQLPLDLLAQIYQGIRVTSWFQAMIGSQVIPTAMPQYQITSISELQRLSRSRLKITDKQKTQALDRMLMRSNPEKQRSWAYTIRHAEGILRNIDPISPELQSISEQLGLYCTILLVQLAETCEILGYPLKQWEWKDQLPLNLLREVYPGIETTDWYQRFLGTLLQPTNHHMYVLKTFSEATGKELP